MKLDNQEELLWKLTYRVSDLTYILGDIFQVATDRNNDDLQVREEVIRIISGASQLTNQDRTTRDRTACQGGGGNMYQQLTEVSEEITGMLNHISSLNAKMNEYNASTPGPHLHTIFKNCGLSLSDVHNALWEWRDGVDARRVAIEGCADSAQTETGE